MDMILETKTHPITVQTELTQRWVIFLFSFIQSYSIYSGNFWNVRHYYSNDICFQLLFAQRANEIIKDHKKKHSRKPMFLYLPFQNVHWPYQVPKKYEQMYPNIKHPLRRIFSGMYNDNICIFFVQIFRYFSTFYYSCN